ncbi:MAG: hypothetical protein KGL62_07975 [Bradyrhizobium sp.]|uniref:hypothetical protein n=1 Tax=Bradyrhizobium sp. TaxID=376 RepID=UPI00239D7007|nr:hypothetical protein [Bradyrhizobium sp.]MDE2602290.1 hypothetical protein [Bradyrhizobium sp.]
MLAAVVGIGPHHGIEDRPGWNVVGQISITLADLSGSLPLGVPRFVYELETVAVEVGDVRGVVAGRELGSIGWLTLVGPAGFDGSCVGRVNQFVGVADDAEIKPGLARLALTQPDTRSDRLSTAVSDATLSTVTAAPMRLERVSMTSTKHEEQSDVEG